HACGRTYPEIIARTFCLRTPVATCGYFDFAHRVAFNTKFHCVILFLKNKSTSVTACKIKSRSDIRLLQVNNSFNPGSICPPQIPPLLLFLPRWFEEAPLPQRSCIPSSGSYLSRPGYPCHQDWYCALWAGFLRIL